MRLGAVLRLQLINRYGMQRVLVTGANGFIGKMLCQTLAARPYEVSGLVRTVREPVQSIEYVEADLEHSDSLRAACQDFDCIVHLAGRAHVLSEYDGNPLEAFRRANCAATLRLAQQAVQSGVRRFIFISSIGVNGAETFEKPFDEFSSSKPHADYAISKLEAEEGLKKLLAGAETELVIIRPPLVYGIDAPGNFGRLLKLVATGLPLPLGGANNRRSIISLENLVSFISLCIEHPAAAGQLFLVSDGRDISTTQMVKALAQGMGKKPLMLPVPDALLKVGAKLLGKESLYTQLYRSLQVDSSKARSLLGWKPQENTLEALQKIGRLCAV